ncbi:hypothetical protein [Romboutsia sp.]|uniref:hypothetical protein n=1 Tax=Romboutsia sp. TaxID=1965302 RepID=UPI003F398BB4
MKNKATHVDIHENLNLEFTYEIDNTDVFNGDILTHTIKINNTTHSTMANLILKNNRNNNLKFIEHSLTVNDIFRVGENLSEDIVLGELEPDESLNITYKTKVTTLSDNTDLYQVLLYSNVNQHFIINSNKVSFKMSYLNEVEKNMIEAKIGNNNFKRKLSKVTAQIGDVVTSSLLIENTGRVECKHLKIYEPINNSLEFVEGSLLINNENVYNADIFKGVSIYKVSPNEVINVSYELKIIDISKPNPIDSRVSLDYSFLNKDIYEPKTIYSTKCKLYINNPSLYIKDNNLFIKDNINYKYCYSGDYIFFNLSFENKGNVGLENIYLNFNFPPDLVLDRNTLKINNALYSEKLQNFIKLPNLNISQIVNVEFYAKHSFIEKYNLDVSFALDYTFRDIQNQSPCKKSNIFNESIVIVNPNLEVNKFISDKDIEIDREFTKNINIKNTGNIALRDVHLFLNESEFLKRCSNTIFINGTYKENNKSISIDVIDINETVNIAIRYKVDTLPLHETILPESEVVARYSILDGYPPVEIIKKSNKLSLNIKNYSLDITGKCSSNTLMLDSKTNYIFNIVNTGNIKCSDIKLSLNLPECIQYVENSLYVNGKQIDISNSSDLINIGALNSNESIIVSFSFYVSNFPYKKQVKINGILYGQYSSHESVINKSFISNETILNVENISLDIVKTASSDYLQNGDIVKIQTILNNTGSVDLKLLYFKDNIETNLSFVDNSVYIDGENIENTSPLDGIALNDLDAGQNILLSYEYEYIQKSSGTKIMNFSDIFYSYSLDDTNLKNINMKSNILYFEGALSTFKQFSIENEYILKDFEPSISDIASVTSNAKIEHYYDIDSIKNKSVDNFSSTGKKVIVNGFVINRVEYLSNNENPSVYVLERTDPFTIFINLPSDCNSEDVVFKANCDNIFYKTTSQRGVFVSSLISIEGVL